MFILKSLGAMQKIPNQSCPSLFPWLTKQRWNLWLTLRAPPLDEIRNLPPFHLTKLAVQIARIWKWKYLSRWASITKKSSQLITISDKLTGFFMVRVLLKCIYEQILEYVRKCFLVETCALQKPVNWFEM